MQGKDVCGRLTFPPALHTLSRTSGEQTKMVNPAKNRHAEYDMNITGHCHVNIIFRRGFHTLP